MTATLYVEKLSAFYKRQPVLTDLTLGVSGGEHVALMGPNGSGKTTLLRALLGQVPYRGGAWVHGLEVRSTGARSRARLGYVPQQPTFPGSLTGAEIVTLWQRLRGVRPDPLPLLTDMGLGPATNQKLSTYSGGMLRRLSLALAEIGDNSVMLLDEPEAGLDREGQAWLSARFEAWRERGVTVLFTVHDGKRLPQVDRLVYLEGGRLIYDGKVDRQTRLLQLAWRGPLPLLERLATRLRHLPQFEGVDISGAFEPILTTRVSETVLVAALAPLHPLEPELRLSVREPGGPEGLLSNKPSEEALCGTSG